jgi:hypothetical protein
MNYNSVIWVYLLLLNCHLLLLTRISLVCWWKICHITGTESSSILWIITFNTIVLLSQSIKLSSILIRSSINRSHISSLIEWLLSQLHISLSTHVYKHLLNIKWYLLPLNWVAVGVALLFWAWLVGDKVPLF